MRLLILPVCVAFALVVISGSGCGSGVAISGDGGDLDGSPGDGAANDSATGDGSTLDGGSCVLMGGTYDKACVNASDCTTVARGCYCGGQPVLGIAKSGAAAAQDCETKAQNNCGLGCANFPGRVAEDGKSDVDGGTIKVLCDNSQCHTVLQ